MNSCNKNVDSTFDKLIYNVPLDQNYKISDLLKGLESNSKLQIDIEMNSLEDAYVKIDELEQNQISEIESLNNIDRFQDCRLDPSFKR